jgi:hypothetical protein
VQIGYGLEIEKMREWGFLVSRGEGSEEPQLYGEPGLFLIRADEIVYYQAINSMPFGRPELQEMLTAIGNVKKMDIPAHGERRRIYSFQSDRHLSCNLRNPLRAPASPRAASPTGC